jgi:hypothetical protein
VYIAFMQELAADGFSRTALKEHVIGHHDCGPAMNFQLRFNMLQEVEPFRLRNGVQW